VLAILTQECLKELLHYDPDTGIFTWKVSKGASRAGAVAGFLNKGYSRIRIDGNYYSSHRLAWLYVNNIWPDDQIDHINGIKLDNRICNLRMATNAENQQNYHLPKANNKSGFLGVSLHKPSKKFMATIRINGIKKNLGYFSSAEEAHDAYLEAKRKHHKFCTI